MSPAPVGFSVDVEVGVAVVDVVDVGVDIGVVVVEVDAGITVADFVEVGIITEDVGAVEHATMVTVSITADTAIDQ